MSRSSRPPRAADEHRQGCILFAVGERVQAEHRGLRGVVEIGQHQAERMLGLPAPDLDARCRGTIGGFGLTRRVALGVTEADIVRVGVEDDQT